MTDVLRLVMPQWQGGNNPAYYFGSKLLAWLAPPAGSVPEIQVPVEPYDGTELSAEDGVVARSILLKQLQSARKIIEAYEPKRIVVFGGDCLVAQVPFAYLNERYEGRLGVLWLDAHPDVSTPEMHLHEHAMVLGNLLGEGDPVFSAEVRIPLDPERVMYGGLQETLPLETEIVSRLHLRKAGPEELSETSGPVLDWIKEKEIRQLAIHLDLDVLDPKRFRSLLFAQPDGTEIDAAAGAMTLPQISRLIQDISIQTDVVGLAIAEHLPWEAIHLREFLGSLPIFQP